MITVRSAATCSGLCVLFVMETRAASIERLSQAVNAAVARPEVRRRLADLNLVAQGSTPAQLGEHLAADVRRWSDVIARAGIPRQ